MRQKNFQNFSIMEPDKQNKIILTAHRIINSKKCTVCGIEKTLQEFPPRLNPTKHDTLFYKTTYNQCRICTAQRKKEQRERRKRFSNF